MTAQAHQSTEPVSGVLRDIGRPVAYYPGLAPLLGGVKAALLFCQLRYWQSRVTGGRAVHKTSDELCAETGLSYAEQRVARRSLKKLGVLIETQKRLEHRIYFLIDEDALERLLADGEAYQSKDSAACGQPASRNEESAFREMNKLQSANCADHRPRTDESAVREEANLHSVKGVKTTAKNISGLPSFSGNCHQCLVAQRLWSSACYTSQTHLDPGRHLFWYTRWYTERCRAWLCTKNSCSCPASSRH